MFSKLDHNNKRLLLYFGMALVLYGAWVCSFKNTVEAVLLNNQLTKNERKLEGGLSAMSLISQKHNFYNTVVKSYRVNHADPEGHIWQVLSGVAIHYGVEISLEQVNEAALDTVKTKQAIFTYPFSFKGKYGKLVELLDSINRTDEIGRPSGFSLYGATKPVDESEKLTLELRLSLIK